MTSLPFLHEHDAKPGGSQSAPTSWADIDGASFVPKVSGMLLSRLYLVCSHKLRTDRPGVVRFRLVRLPFGIEPLDPTAYDSRTAAPAHAGILQVSGVYVGPVTKGRRYIWQAKALDFAAATYTTRYADWVVFPR